MAPVLHQSTSLSASLVHPDQLKEGTWIPAPRQKRARNWRRARPDCASPLLSSMTGVWGGGEILQSPPPPFSRLGRWLEDEPSPLPTTHWNIEDTRHSASPQGEGRGYGVHLAFSLPDTRRFPQRDRPLVPAPSKGDQAEGPSSPCGDEPANEKSHGLCDHIHRLAHCMVPPAEYEGACAT